MAATSTAAGSGTHDAADTLRKRWSRIARTAVWVMSVLGVFLIRPPGLSDNDDRKIVPFAGFLVAALLGLAGIVFERYREGYVWRWCAAAVLCTALSVASFVVYGSYLSRWTEPFASTRIVVGTRWTPVGERVRREYPSVADMLPDFGGRADVLWEKDELEQRRQALALLYLGCVAASALTMMSIVQAMSCSGRTEDRGPVDS